jgi:ketosteroid isomerase-like protein
MRNQGKLKTMISWIFAVSLVGAPAILAHASPQLASTKDVDLTNPDVAAIVKIAKDFSAAIAVKDFKRIIDVYSPDVVYMSPGVPDIRGKDAEAQSWHDMLSSYDLHVDVRLMEVKILGDYAYDRAVFTMSMKPTAGGKTEEMGGRVFEVLRKENGKWKSLRVMVNSDK